MTKAAMDAAAEKRYEELVKHDDAATPKRTCYCGESRNPR